MSTKTVKSFCRICEAHCGIDVTVEESSQQVLHVKPDVSHPVSKGYACVKGAAIADLHHDPDRVNTPLKKTKNGFVEISWEQALLEIGTRVKGIRKQHSDRSVALYTGNPTFFNYKNILFSQDFIKSLGSPNHYSSHSIDANNKFHVATKMYGLSMVQAIPDLKHTEVFICLGSNPVVSQMSLIQVPNAIGHLKAIEKRGGRVITIDPRKTETAQKVGEHVFIKPGSDVYLLLAILHEIVQADAFDRGLLDRYAQNVQAALDASEGWTNERAASLTGMPEEVIKDLASSLINANAASLFMSTGVNMGPFGSMCYWLVQVIMFLTGNLDAKGGLIFPEPPFDILGISKLLGVGAESPDRTLKNGRHKVAGCFPVSALEDEITLDHPERIRALFVSCGNPVRSVPGNHLPEALDELDLMVSIDLYLNDTAQHADYVLPATDMLERSDYPISWASLQLTPHAQFTEAVVDPIGERKEEWEIFGLLARACDSKLSSMTMVDLFPRLNKPFEFLFNKPLVTPDHVLSLMMRVGGKHTLDALRQAPQGLPLSQPEPGYFLENKIPTESGKIDLAPQDILQDLKRVEALASAEHKGFQLIGMRERKTHNTWMHNVEHIKHPQVNKAVINPLDAKALKLVDGDAVLIESDQGAFNKALPIRISDEVMPGVIAVPHGWGHTSPNLKKASALSGEDINRVIPGGEKSIEPVSGQSIMTGAYVQVIPVKAADVISA